MVFLIILIVAVALLSAWLLFELARAGRVDLRFPRLRESSLGGGSTSGSALPAVGGTAPEQGEGKPEAAPGRRHAEKAQPRRAGEARRRREKAGQQRALYDETDVEQAVRDRLYGRHGRRD